MLAASSFGSAAGPDTRATNQEGQVGRGLVGEELAAEDPVLTVEEAVVGGEDDVGVVQEVQRTELVDDLLTPSSTPRSEASALS